MSEKKAFRYRGQPNYKGTDTPFPSQEEEPSKTVPNRAITIKQLNEDYVRGKTTPIKPKEKIFADFKIPRFEDYSDAIDFDEHVREAETAHKTALKSLNDYKNKKAAEKKQAAAIATAQAQQKTIQE